MEYHVFNNLFDCLKCIVLCIPEDFSVVMNYSEEQYTYDYRMPRTTKTLLDIVGTDNATAFYFLQSDRYIQYQTWDTTAGGVEN